MLFPTVGDPVGLVSGGCLEADLAERAAEVLRSGRSHTVVYDMRSPDDIVWGLGLGCNGEVRVLLERLGPGPLPPYLAFLESCHRGREAGVVATLFEVTGEMAAKTGDRSMLGAKSGMRCEIDDPLLSQAVLENSRAALRHGRSGVRSYTIGAGRAEALIEHVAPAVSLLVFGAGRDAEPLVRLAAQLGWEVTVADNRPAYARPERFPEAGAVRLVRLDRFEDSGLSIDARTAVVLMTHHFLHDLELLAVLLGSPAAYLGLLGPRKRSENLLAELGRRGIRIDPHAFDRLYGPAGLDIGAETPEEIALAILAEIQAVLDGKSAGFLRERAKPLHDWPR